MARIVCLILGMRYPGYSRRRVGPRLSWDILLVFGVLVVRSVSGGASDANLNSALLRAGCGSPSIKLLYEREGVTVYEANCSRSSHRVVTVVCTKRQGCHVNQQERDSEPPQ